MYTPVESYNDDDDDDIYLNNAFPTVKGGLKALGVMPQFMSMDAATVRENSLML